MATDAQKQQYIERAEELLRFAQERDADPAALEQIRKNIECMKRELSG